MTTATKFVNKADSSKVYAFNSRYNYAENARAKAIELHESGKLAYYVRVQERGNHYYDVRVAN